MELICFCPIGQSITSFAFIIQIHNVNNVAFIMHMEGPQSATVRETIKIPMQADVSEETLAGRTATIHHTTVIPVQPAWKFPFHAWKKAGKREISNHCH